MTNFRLSFGVFLISLAALMLELLFVRVFDALFNPVSSYLIVSCAIYSLGLSGLYVHLKTKKNIDQTRKYVSRVSCVFSIFTVLVLVFVNGLSLLFRSYPGHEFVQVVSYVGVYIVIAIPFFLVGLVLASLFLSYHRDFHLLYCWDLLGASIGCVIIIPLLPSIGPGGLLFVAAAFGLWASALFLDKSLKWLIVTVFTGLALFCTPFFLTTDYVDFSSFKNKRGVLRAHQRGVVEKVVWDPVSKVEVFKEVNAGVNLVKHIAYDGGSQSSYIFPFDGDYEGLRKQIPAILLNHFWQKGVLASHYLKEGSDQDVLIIGSAGGQETKAALLFGAKKVDAVEMVREVVTLGKTDYADFNGNIFNHPNVSVHVGEGRAFLRRSDSKYDIIQIFSNHASSSIASGHGIISPVYLQTVEAYREYYDHLNSDGILHINHHLFPRMVVTAAKAWKDSGLQNFQKHVVVIERYSNQSPDTLPTVLVKMSPWTEFDIEKLDALFSAPSNDDWTYSLVADPLEPESDRNFLSSVFFTGVLPDELEAIIPYNIAAPTDDKPFFNFFRKDLDDVTAEKGNYYRLNSTGFISNDRYWFIPKDLQSLFFMLIVSLLIGSLILFLPLKFKNSLETKLSFSETSYFCLLGIGFISLEFVLIQMFIKVIGNPLYTFSTIIFTLLLSAGLGSLASSKLVSRGKNYSKVPFLGVLFFGVLIYLSHDFIFFNLLKMELAYRVIFSSIALFPIGFFLGMPFPIGIEIAGKNNSRIVPWLWALNGFFTVFGGFLATLSALFFGLKVTFLIALACYLLAFLSCHNMLKKRELVMEESS